MTPQMQRAYDAFEHDINIEAVIDMAVEAAITLNLGRMSEKVAEDLLDDLVTTNLHPSMKPLAEYLLRDGEDEEDVHLQIDDMACARPDLMGVYLKVATPVRRWDEDGRSCTFSWGHVRLNWVFGETYDQAWAIAVSWAKDQAAPPSEMAP